MAVERNPVKNQRGIALLMALIVLFVIAVVALAVMTNVQSESKIAGHGLRTAQAYNNALAGVGEAISTLRAGNGPQDPTLPRTVAQVVLLAPGNPMPTYAADTTAYPTQQPSGQFLKYSTTTKSGDALTIAYKTDAARTVVYRYDASKSPPINTTTGYPIYVITSTGTDNGDRRRIVTEVVQKPIVSSAKGALAANIDIQFKGNVSVCGYNHRVDTPSQTNGNHPGGPCVAWETGSNDLPAGWSTSTISSQGSASEGGSPAPYVQNQVGFYSGPWDMLGMSQSDFFSWIGPPVSSIPSNANGNYYVDNDGIAQNQSASFGGNGGAGQGLLYIDGDGSFNGNFEWRGLIYVEGDLKMNGNCWILGGLVARGKSTIKCANGSAVLLYSKDAIEQNIAHAGTFLTLSWKESN